MYIYKCYTKRGGPRTRRSRRRRWRRSCDGCGRCRRRDRRGPAGARQRRGTVVCRQRCSGRRSRRAGGRCGQACRVRLPLPVREHSDGLGWRCTSVLTSRLSKSHGGACTRCRVRAPVTRARSRACQGASHTRPGVARPGGRRSWEEGCSHVLTPEGFTLCPLPRQGARGPGAGGRQGAALARRERAAQGQLHPAALQPAAPAGREGPPGAARGGRQAGGGRQAARRRPGRRQGGPELGKAGQSVGLGWNLLGLERGWDWAWRRPDQGLGNAGPRGAQRCRRGQACWLSSLADGPLLSLYVRCVPMCHQAAA